MASLGNLLQVVPARQNGELQGGRGEKRLMMEEEPALRGLVAYAKGPQLLLQLWDITESFQARRVKTRFAF